MNLLVVTVGLLGELATNCIVFTSLYLEAYVTIKQGHIQERSSFRKWTESAEMLKLTALTDFKLALVVISGSSMTWCMDCFMFQECLLYMVKRGVI